MFYRMTVPEIIIPYIQLKGNETQGYNKDCSTKHIKSFLRIIKLF